MIAFNDKFKLGAANCCDKSLAHRAFILAAIADGESTLSNVSTLPYDVLVTVQALRELGAEITFDNNGCATVKPITRLPQKTVTLNCHGSGTTARLLAGLCAGLGVHALFVGDESLARRPMARVIQPLQKLGADIKSGANCLFECMGGELVGTNLTAEVNSAQVKSAVILAGLFAQGTTTYRERLATRNHTELMLKELGADVQTKENVITVRKSRPHAFDYALPNDPSGVAYGVALALLTNTSAVFRSVLLNERRLGFYRVLQRANADIRFQNVCTVLGEKVGDVVVSPSALAPLFATEQDVCDGIDEIPLLAVLSLSVCGVHKFCEVSELALKECDRIQAIKHIADVCGKRCDFDGRDLTISSDGTLPQGKHFRGFGDHRIAMCEAVLCIACGGGSVDADEDTFGVSYRNFLEDLHVQAPRYYLFGTNVTDSLSPTLMAHLAVNAKQCMCYYPYPLAENISDESLSEILHTHSGNVTMPFKVRAARLLGATVSSVNTVYDNGTKCCSTDGYGVVQSLKAHSIRFEGQPLWIVGAGGAAEACVAELIKYGCNMCVIDRTEANATRLKQKYRLFDHFDDPVGVLSFVPQCQFERNLSLPQSCRFVLVADYKGTSGLRIQAQKRKIDVVDGMEMLYHQGAKSFSLWTGTPIQTDAASFLKTKELI